MSGQTNGKTVVGDKTSDDRLMGYLEAYHSYDKGVSDAHQTRLV